MYVYTLLSHENIANGYYPKECPDDALVKLGHIHFSFSSELNEVTAYCKKIRSGQDYLINNFFPFNSY